MSHAISQQLKRRIKEIRQRLGYKQQAMAAAMGCSQQAYCQLENNARRARIDKLEQLCAALQLPLTYLLSNEPVTDENLKQYTTNPAAK